MGFTNERKRLFFQNHQQLQAFSKDSILEDCDVHDPSRFRSLHTTTVASLGPAAHESEKGTRMLVITTPTLEGHPIQQYLGMVSGETIAGVNLFKDFGAGAVDRKSVV